MGSTEAPEGLTKIYVELPNHHSVAGEAMWGRALGPDRYELRNVPFHAYDLNFLDVVDTVRVPADPRPRVARVIRRSGHLTLRVSFDDGCSLEERIPLLRSLGPLGASFESASPSYFALDVEPGGDYQAICQELGLWQSHGVLWFETCGARVTGSFDDLPAR